MKVKAITQLIPAGAFAFGLAWGIPAQAIAEEHEEMAASSENAQPEEDQVAASQANANDEEAAESATQAPDQGDAPESTQQ